MLFRRLLFFAIVITVAAGLTVLLAMALAPGGWPAWKIVALAAFAGTAPWTGICAANGMIGFAILVVCRDPVRCVFPAIGRDSADVALPPTALTVMVRNEDMDAVLPPLARLLDGLDASGSGAAFTAFILSDTPDGERAVIEAEAVARFAVGRGGKVAVRYRRRGANVGMKAGNLMDFLDHHAASFALAVVLDADSEMSAAAVLRLTRAMVADPTLGIVQHLTVGRPTQALFPRLFQFGMRAGMRVWATGQAWWQGAEGPYWGHNAILRIAPFRAHCRLPPFADGSTILSHDQVEAAMIAGAGWGVRVLPSEDGSHEGNPPALPEFIQRDARWLAGNLQYVRLLAAPGLRPMGRWQLAQAVLMFVVAPLYVIFAAACAAGAAGAPSSASRPRLAVTLAVAWIGAIYAPKLAGYAETALFRARRQAYGGLKALAFSAAIECLFALILDPIMQVSKTLGIMRAAVGSVPGWLAQNRSSRRIGWREATKLLALPTVFGVLLVLFMLHDRFALLLFLPFGAGLLLAIPFCVATASPELGRMADTKKLCAAPEELRPSG